MMDFYQTGNVFIKRMYFDFSQGYVRAIGHSHKHDHVTLLAFGVLTVKVGEKETTYHAPATINIEAGKHHEMTALMDKTVAYCIHDTRGLEVEELGCPFEEVKCRSAG